MMNRSLTPFTTYRGLARTAFAGAVVLLSSLSGVRAQLNVAAVNTAYTVNFDGTVTGVSSGAWAGGGFQPTPTAGRLDSDAWAVTGWSDGNLGFGGTRITAGTDYRRGTALAAVAAGGMYAFDDGAGGVLTGMALGFQPGASDWEPGTIILRAQNNTGSTLTAFDVAYDVFYRNDQNSSNTFNLSYSDDNVTYTNVPSQDVTSPAGSTGAAWVSNARSTTINGVVVPNGGYFYIRWRGTSVSVSGARDEFALDNISVTGHANTVVRLTASSSTVSEAVGTTTITASIVNPHPSNATSVDLVLTSGPAARVNGFTTQTITFPGGSLANQSVTITVSDNGACDGDATEVFTLQNVTGGISPGIGTPSTFTMTIDDDETTAATWNQGFDGGVGDTWGISAGAGNVSSTPGATDTPASQRVLSPTSSWQVRNTTATLDLQAADITDWFGITLTARVSSTSLTGTEGNDGSDSIAFYVNLDGAGFPTDPDIRIAGNSNARWGYSTGTGVASTTAGVPVNYQPGAGGNRTTDGYSYVSITVPDGTTTVALRVVAKNNSGSEVWNLEDVHLSGTLCSPVYYSRANGSETTATWSTARTGAPAAGAVTFNKNRSMVVQNGHTVSTTNNASIALRNLTVETGGTLNLTGTSNVDVNGPTFKIDGTFAASDDDISLLCSSLTTVSGAAGTIDVNNLTCDGGGVQVTVNTLKVRGTLQLDNGAFDANNKEVQLLSTASGTARLGPVGTGASYVSKLRMERYIPAGATDWRLLCSPVQNKTVNDWTDDFYTAGFPGSYYPNFYVNAVLWPSVRMYDETNAGLLDSDGLIGVSSTAEPLTVGKGFAAWSGTTLNTTTAFTVDVRGNPTVASTPFTIPMSYTNTAATAAVDGLNLVGNPLPSPIDFGSLSLGADVDNSYYIYDPGAGVNVGWDETTAIGTGGCNGNIQSSQGFWLHCTGPANTVTVTESAKVLEPINGGVFSMVQDTRSKIRLELSGGGNPYTDEALVHFIAGTPAYGERDMVKLAFGNDNAMRITTQATTGEDLMINAYGELNSALDIPVKVEVPVSGQYTITMRDVATMTGRACMSLRDQLTGTETMMNEGATYTFTMDAAAPVEPARFVLHVASPVNVEKHPVTCAGVADGRIVVEGPGAGPWDLSLVLPNQDVITRTGVTAAEFTGLGGGEYQLYVEGNTGCGALVQTVLLDEPFAIEGSATTTAATCADATDGTIDLSVMGGTAPYSYTWSNGTTQEDISTAAPGSYNVTVIDANGCHAVLPTVNVVAGSGPVASFTSVSTTAPYEDVLFFNTGTYGLEYLWNFGDGSTSNESEPVHLYTEAGNYTVTLTATNGECSVTATGNVEVAGPTGIAAHEQLPVNAWVDGDRFRMEWSVPGITGLKAEVMDATGKVVMGRTGAGSVGRMSVPAGALPAGVYFMRVTAGSTQHTFKLPLAR